MFVPGGEWLMIDIFWLVRNKIVFSTNSSDHFYTSETRSAHLLFLSFVLFYLLLFRYNKGEIYGVCMRGQENSADIWPKHIVTKLLLAKLYSDYTSKRFKIID